MLDASCVGVPCAVLQCLFFSVYVEHTLCGDHVCFLMLGLCHQPPSRIVAADVLSLQVFVAHWGVKFWNHVSSLCILFVETAMCSP